MGGVATREPPTPKEEKEEKKEEKIEKEYFIMEYPAGCNAEYGNGYLFLFLVVYYVDWMDVKNMENENEIGDLDAICFWIMMNGMMMIIIWMQPSRCDLSMQKKKKERKRKNQPAFAPSMVMDIGCIFGCYIWMEC